MKSLLTVFLLLASSAFAQVISGSGSLSSAGVLSGSGQGTPATLPVVITGPATPLPNGTNGSAYSQPLTVSGGTGPYTCAATSGTLPTGLSFSGCTLQGTPTATNTFNFNVQATDSVSAHSVSVAYQVTINSTGASCGPPTYSCSRTDLANAAPASSVPSIGTLTGVNTIVTDPDFQNRIVRATDTTFLTGTTHNSSFWDTCGGGGEEDLFNSDSSMFVVQDEGCSTYPVAFNPSTFQVSKIYPALFPTGAYRFGFAAWWKHGSRTILHDANGVTIENRDFTDWLSGPQTTPPVPTTAIDFTAAVNGQHNCLPAGFTSLSTSVGGGSAGDTIAMAYSSTTGQGSSGMVYVVAYTPGKGCAMWNTASGAITTDPGYAGGAGLTCTANGCSGTIPITDRFTVHNVKIGLSDSWLVVTATTCTATCVTGFVNGYFWNIGTTTVGWCGQGGRCSGHAVTGNTHFVNNSGSNHIWQDAIRTIGYNTTSSLIIPLTLFPTFPSSGIGTTDAHYSWNNADAADSYPIFWTSYVHGNTAHFGWENEVLATFPNTGVTVRFAHSFNTTNSQLFQVATAEGSISQDGRYLLLTTDWMGTLGSESGGATCTLGSNCRGEVVIVELK